MNIAMMDSMVGASRSLDLAVTCMGIYSKAEVRGDKGTMERALKLAGQSTQDCQKFGEQMKQALECEQEQIREQAKAQNKADAENAAKQPSKDTVTISQQAAAAAVAAAQSASGNTGATQSPDVQAAVQAAPSQIVAQASVDGAVAVVDTSVAVDVQTYTPQAKVAAPAVAPTVDVSA